LLASAASLLAGCIDLAPPYHRPPAPVPAAFPTGPAYPPPAAQPVAIVGWTDFFSDPKLKTVIEAALANNRDLRVAVANITASRAQYVAQRAELFPTIDVQAQANYGREPVGGALHEHLYSVTAGFSAYQVDLFGRVRDLTRAAQDQYFASRQARDAAQITLVSEVAIDYLTLGADQALLQIARETLQSATASRDVVQSRLDAGVSSGLDLAQAETVVQQARFDVARLTTQIAQDRNALDLVVGEPVSENLLPHDIQAVVVVLERLPAALDSSVLLRRPDVLEAEDQLRAANADIGAARAAFFPDVTLTGSGGVASTALSSLLGAASKTWTFVPAATQTIFAAGANLGNLEFAKARREALIANYEKAIQTAFREVADALADRGTIDERIAAQQSLTAASQQALQLSTARYEHGSDSYLNVLAAQRIYYTARQTLVANQLAKTANLVTLYAVLGGGLSD
jgi:multidrug efflux system outer membrane protein